MNLQENIQRIREMIDKVKNVNQFINESVGRTFKNKILSSLKDKLGGYDKLPKEIKDLIIFNQIPLDVYQKINDYYDLEKSLPSDTYIETYRQKLKSVGKGVDEDFLGFLGFIELIGIDKFGKYNTIDLYNDMLEEIRNLPNKNIISFKYNNLTGVLAAIKKTPEAYVVLFSAGCKYSSAASKEIKNKYKLFIVEPYNGPKGYSNSVNAAVSNGVPSLNVITGPDAARGMGIVSGSTKTPKSYLPKHWGALNYVTTFIK